MKFDKKACGIIFKCAIALLWMVTLYYFVLKHLAIGGRWDTGLPLAMADNFLQGEPFYPSLENGLRAGSSYFPFNAIFSLFARLLFGYNAETALIILTSIPAVFLVWGFSKVVSDKKNVRFISCIILFLLFSIHFTHVKFYLFEMHPDLIAICFFLWGIIYINYILKKEKQSSFNWIFAGLIFFLSAMCKQTAAFLFIGLFFYLLFTRTIQIKDKIKISLTILFSGILTILAVFLLENCFLNTVIVNSKHPLLEFCHVKLYFTDSFKDTFIYSSLMILSIFLLLIKKLKFKTELSRMWFLPAFCWMIFNFYTSLKYGANGGNVEAAIISMAPYAIIVLIKIWDDLKSAMKNIAFVNKIVEFLSKERFLKYFYPIMSLILIISTVIASYCIIKSSFRYYSAFRQRLNDEQTLSICLEKVAGGKNAMINSIHYEIFNNTTIGKITDLYTFGVFKLGNLSKEDDLEDFKNRFDIQTIITTKEGFTPEKYPEFFKSFELIDNPCCTSIPILIYERKN